MNKLVFKLFYWNIVIKIFFLFFVVFLAGCTFSITGKTANSIPYETSKNPEVYFCPREDCGKVLESHINSANSSVHCALYDLNLKNVINSLAKKSKIIDIKVVLDSSNQNGQIKGDGLRMDDDGQLMHNKFCIFDENTVVTGSFNPTSNDNEHNNNNILVAYSTVMAKNFEDEFNELWDGKFGKGTIVKNPVFYVNDIKIENYFCPEDKCSSQIIKLIKNAKSRVYFMAFSFTNEEIADALINIKDLDIKGVFDLGQSSSKFSQFERLKGFGIAVKKDKSKYKMHHKVFIIDNETVVTGSFNPTLSADTRNDENLLLVHDKKIAELYLKEFESLWD